MDKIDEKLSKEIHEYCILNKIEDVNKFINDILRVGFTIEKYGFPSQNKNKLSGDKIKPNNKDEKNIYDE